MFSKVLPAAAVALATCQMAYAQTSTSCNPLKQSCPADPAIGGIVDIDFTKGPSDFFDVAAYTTLTYDPTMGAVFTIKSPAEAPTITSKKYLFFGRVDVVVQAAPGTGIVTSSVLQSDDLDEIDWEWLGGDTTEVQTNYFSKGDTSTYNRGGKSGVASPQSGFHTYTIDWTAQRIQWIIDGAVVRTLNYADSPSTYPQTPMQLKLGTWDGGAPSEPSGTAEWAGGRTNFANAPFIGYYKSVRITDYSNGVSGATSYVYGDHSGTYQSIQVKTGGSSGGDRSSKAGSSSSDPPSTTAAPSTSAASSSAASSSAAMSTSKSTMMKKVTTATSASSANSSSASAQSTGSSSSSGSSATAAVTTTAAPSKTSAPANSGAFKSASALVLAAAALFASYLIL